MALCVLTGDIVGSTDLTAAEMDTVHAVLARVRDTIGPDAALLDTYRGDGWQLSLAPEGSALRYALYVRASLTAEDDKFATRIALAEGGHPFDPANTTSGPYIRSGRCLDAMPKEALMAHAAGGARHAATLLADQISRTWTTPQAKAIQPFLLGASDVTQKAVAENLSISRQAVGQALDAAGYHPIRRALAALEEHVK